MKNGLLAWNVVLTLIVGYLLFTHFNKKGVTTVDAKHSTKDSQTVHSPFRIAYFEMDSVENNFNMVKDVKVEISKKDEDYTNSLSQLDNQYRSKFLEYQQKEKNGTLVQADYNELRQLEDRLRTRKQELDQQYQDFVMRKNLGVKKKIEDFLTEYNKTKGYSYIVAYEQGLFYYKDTVYNITREVIQGLNEQYKNKKD